MYTKGSEGMYVDIYIDSLATGDFFWRLFFKNRVY